MRARAWLAAAISALVACSGDDERGASPAPNASASAARFEAEPGALPVAAPSELDPAKRARLSETGLYSDLARRTVSGDVLRYTPRHALWTDGATKRRWLRLPAGAKIDATDPDRLLFPVGAQLWKEFSRDGRALETRLIERFGPGDGDYWMGAFVWLDDGSDAVLAPDGAADVGGTTHDVPAQKQCWSCHAGEPGRVLGFSRLQVEHDVLAPLTSPPSPPTTALVGDARATRALGVLHANCGHCHNEHGSAWPDTSMVLRLGSDEDVVEATRLFESVVGAPTLSFKGPGKPPFRVAPGDPASSAVVVRMEHRGDAFQMPPLGTERVDTDGLAAVREWVESLAPPGQAGSD